MHDTSSLEVDRETNPTPPDVSEPSTAFISSSFIHSSPSPQAHAVASDTSNDTSPTSTPHGGSTPTRAVVVPGRDRSGTVIARTTTTADSQHARRRSTLRSPSIPAPTTTVRTDTEPESDPDVEMEDASTSSPGSTPGPVPVPVAATSPSASAPGPTPPQQQQQQRRAVGIVGDDDTAALDVGMNLNMLLVGVDDGFVALEQNAGDDLAMGAPPGAPGNMDMRRVDGSPRVPREERREMEDLTPRAGFVALPDTHHHHAHQHPHQQHQHQHVFTHPNAPQHHHHPLAATLMRPQGLLPTHPHPHPHPHTQTVHPHLHTHGHVHAHPEEPGPYREEDVLLSLQLLAYLSKYPHVRQAFYKPRAVFNPALQVRCNELHCVRFFRSVTHALAGHGHEYICATNCARERDLCRRGLFQGACRRCCWPWQRQGQGSCRRFSPPTSRLTFHLFPNFAPTPHSINQHLLPRRALHVPPLA